MLKHGIDPAFSRRGSKFKTPVCRYARPPEAATTRSTNFASVSCCARLTANPGGDWRKAHSKRDCNCANLYYSLPNEHPRTVSGGTHAHVSGQQEATSIPNGTDSPLPRSKKIIIKHCRPLRRLAKLYLRSKGVVHWKEGGRKFSGTGSSQKLVQAKVRKMLRYFNVSSTWPSERLAAEKWKLRLQPPLRLAPVRRLSRPLGRSAPEDGGRRPGPRLGGCLSDPHRLTSFTMSNLTGNNELANSTPELFYQTEQRSPKLHDMHILPRAALNFLVGTIYPQEEDIQQDDVQTPTLANS